MKTAALIGHTGFVGGNLKSQLPFQDLYNSQNISEIEGKDYDLIICAGARAEKWRINQEPEKDRAEIKRLTDALSNVTAKQFVLISTVDVYPQPLNVNEDSIINRDECSPYGLHRLELEDFCTKNFSATVLRLPGLFGPGLKKNIIFDLLNNNQVERIHADGSFQFYYLERIGKDVMTILERGLPLVNMATEPVTVREIAKEAFGKDFSNYTDQAPVSYDFHTKHAELLGGKDCYLVDRATVLSEITDFVRKEQGGES